MSSPWNTIAAPETKFLKDIISEELKRNSQRSENQEHPVIPPRAKFGRDIEDEDLAKILQEEVCKPSIMRNDSYESEDNDADIYWDKFDPVLRKFDPIPLYNSQNQANIHDQKYKNMIYGVDPEAKVILKEMIIEKVFDKVESLISKGKQATILHVYKNQLAHYIVKVFKSSEAQLKAQNERDYLLRLKRAGIPCPKVIIIRKHVLVISLIGQEKPAPCIADVHLNGIHARIAYTLVADYMKTLYNECNLIHANLSEKKILWYRDYCRLIDLSHAVEVYEENALDLLFNDCVNICKVSTFLFF